MPATVFVSFRSSSRHKVALRLNFRPAEVKSILKNYESELLRAFSTYTHYMRQARQETPESCTRAVQVGKLNHASMML